MGLERAIRSAALAAALSAALVSAACDAPFNLLFARASDTWTRSYPLTAGGDVAITNANGPIDIRGGDADKVEIRADRTVRASTDREAKRTLAGLKMTEDVGPSQIRIDAAAGLPSGVSVEIAYHVTVPKGAAVDLIVSNGAVSVTGLNGTVRVRTTNGQITGRRLAGGVTADTTNGAIHMAFSQVGSGAITLHTVNGAIDVSLPPASKVDVSAHCNNGSVSVSGLPMERDVEAPRRLEGRLNGGGTRVALRTVNGGIQVSAGS
ncbi:MAG TPA: DUF4097 family beta strand repeat-containing protein [Vicinamibacterales bacterium]|nr:DUF4097 family beta strand repeat-containing protein [Vicinamibacterales bacterium]